MLDIEIFFRLKVIDEIYIHSLTDGKRIERVASDFVGAISLSGYRDTKWFFATLTSFTTPGIIAQYTFGDNARGEGTWRVRRKTEVKGLTLDDFSSEQVWYESADGTKVPMFIVRHKDTPSDGTAPAFQYGDFFRLHLFFTMMFIMSIPIKATADFPFQ
jgi:prolyl oligopeptidase